MPNISEMRESKFLKKEDVGRGTLATIASCQQHNVAMEGASPEHKWTLTFQELDKPLVLNSTNIQLCAQICGSQDTDHWIGKKVVLYTDPNVSFQGKLVGGIRVRAPKTTVQPAAAPAPIGGSQQSEIERLKAQLAAITGGAASVAVAPPSNSEVMVEEDEIPF